MRSRRALDAACRWGGGYAQGARTAQPPAACLGTAFVSRPAAPLATAAAPVAGHGVAARPQRFRDAAGLPHCRRLSTATRCQASDLPAPAAQASDGELGSTPPPRSSSPRARAPRGGAADANERSLRRLPFVGPKNAEILRNKGLASADALTQLFEKHNCDVSKLEDYLRTEVGVRNRQHVSGIARAVLHLHQGLDPTAPGQHSDVTICVEGNISAGKSTFLEAVKHTTFGQTSLRIVPEPVDRWTAVPEMCARSAMGGGGSSAGPGSAAAMQELLASAAGASGDLPPGLNASEAADVVAARRELNILQKFYEDSPRWAYTFQSWVFFTRFMQERDSNVAWNAALAATNRGAGQGGSTGRRRGGRRSGGGGDAGAAAAAAAASAGGSQHRLMERSVFSDRMVFVEALKQKNTLTDLEAAIYDQWFTFMLQDRPSLVPDAFIYLRATPDTCQKRMKIRSRQEEAPIQIDYLNLLHDKHDNWFAIPPKAQEAGLWSGAQASSAGGTGAMNVSDGSAVWTSEGKLTTWVGSSLQMKEYMKQDPQSWGEVNAAIRDATYGLLPRCLDGIVQFLDLGSTTPGVRLPEHAQLRVPALVLNCDDSVDLVRDQDARQRYADLVREFYLYVERLKSEVWQPLRRVQGGAAASHGSGGTPADGAERERMRQRIEKVCASFGRLSAEKLAQGGVVMPTQLEVSTYGSKQAVA